MNKVILAAVAVAISGLFTSVQAADSQVQAIALAPTTVSVADASPGFGKRFNMTDEQLEKLNALKLAYKSATAGKKAQLGVLQGQLRDAMTQPSVDKAALLSLQGQINSLKADLANSKVSLMADSSTVFTAEQRQQFRHFALMRGGKGGFGHGRGHGGRSWGGCGARGGHGGPGGHAPDKRA